MSKKDGIGVTLSTEELAALINTLSFARAVFEQSMQKVAEDGDIESAKQLQERVETCSIFIDVLIKNMHIGEPTNDTLH